MNGKKVRDMTAGNPTEHILKFAFPIFVGNLFQQLYNMVDSLVVGNYVGSDSLAAIGTCASINFLFVALAMGLANGVGVIVSQYFGAGNDKGIRATIANSYYVVLGAALLTTVVGLFYAEDFLRLISTPESILPEATLYLKTMVCGVIFISLYNSVAAVLRALGDSKTPLYFLICSSLINVALDLLFVMGFDMGVRGAGIATVISQACAAILSLSYAFIKVPYYRSGIDAFKPHKHIILHSIKLGVPIALQSSMIAVSMIVLQGVVNTYGAVVMASYTISSKVDLIVSQLYGAMQQSMVYYTGQNFGAGNEKRIRMGLLRGVIIVTVYNLLVVPIVWFNSGAITDIFVDDAQVVEFGRTALRITSSMYFMLGLIYVPRGVLNGCGDASFSLINGITEVICRVVYSHWLTSVPSIGVKGIWWAAGLTWATVCAVCMIRYLIGPWRKKIPRGQQLS